MTQTTSTIPKAALRGTASGIFFMAFFETLWAYTGIMGLQGWGIPWLLIIAVAIGSVLYISGVFLLRASRELPNQVQTTAVRYGKRTFFWFNIIFAAELLAIAITVVICQAARHTELIPIVVAFIVGAYFLPLAYLFQVKVYYVTGGLLCLLAILTFLFVPEKITLGEHEILSFMSLTGIGSAFILWGTGLSILVMGKKLIRFAQLKTSISEIGM
ncbi:hypothetical protein WQ54_12260 [Bacillus sp. SA1-12]|uniref:hypothetical protein n=1 Tax=Bacillus sp. SA1-12 TaxID=1455638 RepID=UPI000626AC1A|nr:hypothetical protein [Bacillus sp. SA1-12]KKI91897.1 hypothetical protein WQ54_12260 [Bacillus sp. SA1-12]